jgi:ABC-type Na+ transport system ATPase subunit NatA
VGRDREGHTTFVMLLRTQLAPNCKSVKIASVELVKEPKHSKSNAVVAIVSDSAKKSRIAS